MSTIQISALPAINGSTRNMLVAVQGADGQTGTVSITDILQAAEEADFAAILAGYIRSADNGSALAIYGSGTALPDADVGPIWHADYNSLMTWQVFDANGADYTGYASIDVGRLRFDTQPTPRPGEVRSNGSSSSNTGFPQLRAWAMHNGLFVPVGDWQQDHLHFADNGDGTFRLPDMRSNFIRIWDDGRGVDAGRVFGSSQLDAMQRVTGSVMYDAWAIDADGAFSRNISTDLVGGNLSNGGLPQVVTFDSSNSPGARTAEETRPRNLALPAPLKY